MRSLANNAVYWRGTRPILCTTLNNRRFTKSTKAGTSLVSLLHKGNLVISTATIFISSLSLSLSLSLFFFFFFFFSLLLLLSLSLLLLLLLLLLSFSLSLSLSHTFTCTHTLTHKHDRRFSVPPTEYPSRSGSFPTVALKITICHLCAQQPMNMHKRL